MKELTVAYKGEIEDAHSWLVRDRHNSKEWVVRQHKKPLGLEWSDRWSVQSVARNISGEISSTRKVNVTRSGKVNLAIAAIYATKMSKEPQRISVVYVV